MYLKFIKNGVIFSCVILTTCTFNPINYKPDLNYGYLYGQFFQDDIGYQSYGVSGLITTGEKSININVQNLKYNIFGSCQFKNITTKETFGDFYMYTKSTEWIKESLRDNRPRELVSGKYKFHKCVLLSEYNDFEYKLDDILENNYFEIYSGKITYIGEIKISKPKLIFKHVEDGYLRRSIYSTLDLIQNPISNIKALKNNYPFFSKLPIVQPFSELKPKTSILDEWS